MINDVSFDKPTLCLLYNIFKNNYLNIYKKRKYLMSNIKITEIKDDPQDQTISSTTSIISIIDDKTRTSSKTQKSQESQKTQKSQESQVNNQEETIKQDLSPSLEHDRYFLEWLKKTHQSLLVCSYKTNYVFCIGFTILLEPEVREQMSFWMTPGVRPMGACVNGNDIYIGTMSQITKYTKLDGNKEDEQTENVKRTPFDGYYVPRQNQIIGDIDCHDIVVDQNNEVYYVSALFGCVCKNSNVNAFEIFWRPPWLTKTAAEDRCHLNGLCIRNGEPRYVTCVARTDVRGAWRNQRIEGGVIWDIKENKLVCANLSMPHSPRWHNGKLWVLNSGHGEFGYVDFTKTKKTEEGEEYHPFVSKCFIPSYLRGLCFIGNDYAVIGKSQDRHEKTFQELPLGKKLAKNKIESTCGVSVVDLKRFDVVHELTLDSPINEIYDVVSIPNISRPMLEINNSSILSQLFDFKDIE
jgi:uncharacterized protein (TIGR03032 family)